MFKISKKIRELAGGDLIFLEFLFIIYIVSSVLFLSQPGLCEDEAYHVDPVLHILKNAGPTYLSAKIFGHDIFLMLNSWTGPVCPLLFLPSLYLFGINVYTIRLTRIFFGFINILLLYYVAKQFFGNKVAKIASFLMATMPYYIFSYRQGYLDDGILPTFLLLSLLFFYLFYKKQKAVYLFLGSLFSGIGVCAKLNFLWFLMALSASLIILRIKIVIRSKKDIAIALLIFVLAVFPLLIFNLAGRSQDSRHFGKNNIIKTLQDNFVHTYLGENNANLYKNIKTNLFQLKVIFNNITSEYHNNYSVAIPNPFYFYLFIFALFFDILRLILMEKGISNKKLGLFLLMVIMIFLLKNYTPSVFRIEHSMIIIPLAIIIVADFIAWVFRRFDPVIACYILFIISYFNLVSLSDTYRLLHNEAITSMYYSSHPSSSIYALVDYLKSEHILNPVSLAPRLDMSLKILSQGRIKPVQFAVEGQPEFVAGTDNEYYIASFDPYNKPYFDSFKALVENNNKMMVIDRIFLKRNNEQELCVFELRNKTLL